MNRMAGWYGRCVSFFLSFSLLLFLSLFLFFFFYLDFFKCYQIVFKSGFTILQFTRYEAPVAPDPHQYLVWSTFLLSDNLVSVLLCLVVILMRNLIVLNYIPPSDEGRHSFMCLFTMDIFSVVKCSNYLSICYVDY